VPEKHHVQAELGVDFSLSTGAIGKVVDAAESAEEAADERRLTDAEKLIILEGAASLGLNPPAVIPHIGAAYAPFDGWELGLRLAMSGWRIGARRQLLQQDDSGLDLTIGFGIGGALFDPPIDSVLERIVVDEFTRWNLDVPMAFGQHGSWFRWWAGPRLVYSTTSLTMTLTLPNDREVSGAISGQALYVGGHAGAAFGFRSIFVGPEITLVQLIGDAEVNALGSTTSVDIDSLVVYPAFAVMGEF
jgi:hypothetical protein